MRFLTKEVKTVEELRERTIKGEMNERIKAAFERVAKIEERRQGHVVESSPEEAAPELLEAAKEALNILEGVHITYRVPEHLWDKLKAAIAKAEGKR